MKSSMSTFKRHDGVYTVQIFEAIQELGFRHFTSATEYIVLWYDGVWTPYEVVQKQIKGLPEIPYD